MELRCILSLNVPQPESLTADQEQSSRVRPHTDSYLPCINQLIFLSVEDKPRQCATEAPCSKGASSPAGQRKTARTIYRDLTHRLRQLPSLMCTHVIWLAYCTQARATSRKMGHDWRNKNTC